MTKTKRGEFRQDKAGLHHYHHTKGTGMVHEAAQDALTHRPEGASWFWFNDTPSPIYLDDTADTLLRRWNEWRSSFQKEPESLLDSLLRLTQ